jgi:hypothetical protein
VGVRHRSERIAQMRDASCQPTRSHRVENLIHQPERRQGGECQLLPTHKQERTHILNKDLESV